MNIVVSAPGKIHLLGEHAVVYGNPALLTAVDMRATVSLTAHTSQEIKVTALGKTLVTTVSEIKKNTDQANRVWQEYQKTRDSKTLTSIVKHPIDFVMIAMGETFAYLQKEPKSGFSLTVTSTIPIGAGLGSSGAIAVAVAGSLSQFIEGTIKREEVNKIAFITEQKRHGFPSGGDNTTSCFGGLILFQKKGDTFNFEQLPFQISQTIADNFLLIDSGKPKETTGEMVTNVKKLFEKDPVLMASFLESQGTLTDMLIDALKKENSNQIIEIIKKGEANLETIGVVSKTSQALIREIEKAGGAAKICGGGGIKEGTGMILGIHKDKTVLKKIAQSFNFSSYDVELGAKGVISRTI